MAKNNSQPGENPEETRIGEEVEAQAKAAEEAARVEAKAKEEVEAKIKADAEAKAKAVAAKAETKPVTLRHKTPYEKYRCAGLVLTQKPEVYQVTEAQAEKLRGDPWVVITGDKKDDKSE
jgi:membrane protein involved in colicin uptake